MTHNTPDHSSSYIEPDRKTLSVAEPTTLGRPRRTVVIAATAAALAAAGFGGWAWTDGPLSGDRYCWGTWEEGGSPILSDEALKDEGTRSATDSPPSADQPRGECTLTVKSVSKEISYVDRVSLRYGAAPRDPAERRAWIGEFLYGGGERLPEGLTGIVDTDRGLVVLPKRCDQDGQPTVVTLRAHGTSSINGDSVANPTNLGTERDVASMLLGAANVGMEKAGCSADQELGLTSPFPDPETSTATSRGEEAGPIPRGICDISGWRSGDSWIQTGRDERLEVCSVLSETPQEEPTLVGQFLAASDPRLVELFNGLVEDHKPAADWQGKGGIEDAYALVKAQCHGTPTIYFQQLSKDLQKAAHPGPKQVFVNAVNAATDRAQCDRVTPTS